MPREESLSFVGVTMRSRWHVYRQLAFLFVWSGTQHSFPGLGLRDETSQVKHFLYGAASRPRKDTGIHRHRTCQRRAGRPMKLIWASLIVGMVIRLSLSSSWVALPLLANKRSWDYFTCQVILRAILGSLSPSI